MTEQEVEMFGKVLGNESTCRIFMEQMLKRGVKINTDIDKLSHEDVAEICINVLSELKRREGGSI